MLETLLLMALPFAAEPLADSRAPAKPSVELLEFLGEFGDDEAGLFEDEAAPGKGRKPAGAAERTGAQAPAKPPPRKPAAPPSKEAA